MIVYRLERNGYGPYRFNSTSEIEGELKAKLNNAHASNSQYPSPIADGISMGPKRGISTIDNGPAIEDVGDGVSWDYAFRYLKEAQETAFNNGSAIEDVDGGNWGIPWIDKKYVCGCLREEDLIKWFDGFLEDFKSIGFVVSKYKISENNVYIGRSGKQCMFLKPTD